VVSPVEGSSLPTKRCVLFGVFYDSGEVFVNSADIIRGKAQLYPQAEYVFVA